MWGVVRFLIEKNSGIDVAELERQYEDGGAEPGGPTVPDVVDA